MINRFYPAVLFALLLSQAPAACAKELIKQFSGDRSTNTAEFEVRSPWIMDWLVTGEPSRMVAVDVSLINADTGAYEGEVLRTKTAGNGIRLFKQGGHFYFRVNATMMNWTLKVIQLTNEEAERYTPKRQSSMNR